MPTDAKQRTEIYHYFKTNPLQIKTNSVLGSSDLLALVLYGDNGRIGGQPVRFIQFEETDPEWYVPKCYGGAWQLFETTLPTEVAKTWWVSDCCDNEHFLKD